MLWKDVCSEKVVGHTASPRFLRFDFSAPSAWYPNAAALGGEAEPYKFRGATAVK